MKVKEAKIQLKDIEKYFKGFNLNIVENQRPFAPFLEMSLGDIKTKEFLTKHEDLISASIRCYRSISMEEGRRRGVIEGKNIRSSEFRSLLGCDDLYVTIED